MAQHETIQEMSLASVMSDRFGRYSKYIIQDRALPDIRDGLKPVQRRILYAMYQDRNLSSQPYRKSAKTVGNVIGNYHPHGDISVYEAMVRMSQDWKLREPLIDMHGNNGSMDGDPAAAMRYTEARTSPIAEELLQDIRYQTVDYVLNFDDSLEEPVVLPARFPNLLVNGATGISAGYATEIPPHNLNEVIDGLIYTLTHKRVTLDKIMEFIPAPDFPTGGIIQGFDGIKKAYETGQGRIVVRSVTEIEKLRGNKSQIVVTELPFEVNKSKLIQKIDDIRLQKKVEGIVEVRDESDRQGLRLVIELRREVDAQGILNYLLLNTELQVNYHFNMVAINHLRPEVVGLLDILNAYIEHQQEVITRRTQFQLDQDKQRHHIVEGLIYMMSVLDEVIETIRQSKNKQNAKDNLSSRFEFSQDQAEAIVSLQLYRLTNTDIVALQEEQLELNERIHTYETILADDQTLNKVLVNELRDIKKRFSTNRRTQLEKKIEDISVEQHVTVPQEQVYVSVTREGYLKRTSLRSFGASDTMDLGSREFDYPLFIKELSTHDAIVIVTSKGNYIHLPVHELPDIRWKDMGIHLSQHYQLEDGEQIINVFVALTDEEQESKDTLVFITKEGMIKQTYLHLFTTYRSYKTRTAVAINLKSDEDEVVAVHHAKEDVKYQAVILTKDSYGLTYDLNEVNPVGLRARGVVSINLHESDTVVKGFIIDQSIERPQLMLLTQRGNIKRMDLSEVATAGRGSRGMVLLKHIKSNPHELIDAIALINPKVPLIVQFDTGKELQLESTDINITPRLTNGTALKAKDAGKVLDMHIARLTLLDD